MKEKRDIPPPRLQFPIDRRYFSLHPKARRKHEGMNYILINAHDHWRGIK